jgi:pyridinium-3,5-biscarboxylic acid mononucleotide sulfurtransferase
MEHMSLQLTDKIAALEQWYAQRQGSIVAFSGGIDSALVLFLARKFQGKEKAIGVISKSPSLKHRDFEQASAFCEQFDITLDVIVTRELDDERYNQNPINRCFFCKEHLFHDLTDICQKYPGFTVLSGTNADDLGDYRPGLDAAKKFLVQSPMVDCNVTKEELRQIARSFGLENWNKPASPCLSSRIPYNQTVTVEKLRQIEAAEEILNSYGFGDVRVRHYGSYGRIEVPKHDLENLFLVQNEIMNKINALGFERCEIDTEGLVSGKMNRVLNNLQRQP